MRINRRNWVTTEKTFKGTSSMAVSVNGRFIERQFYVHWAKRQLWPDVRSMLVPTENSSADMIALGWPQVRQKCSISININLIGFQTANQMWATLETDAHGDWCLDFAPQISWVIIIRCLVDFSALFSMYSSLWSIAAPGATLRSLHIIDIC